MTAFEWAAALAPVEPPAAYYCRNDSDWHGRFEKFVPYVRAEGVVDTNLPLVASVLGEVGDNCFAHNVAAWPDLMGCWFEGCVLCDGLPICGLALQGNLEPRSSLVLLDVRRLRHWTRTCSTSFHRRKASRLTFRALMSLPHHGQRSSFRDCTQSTARASCSCHPITLL